MILVPAYLAPHGDGLAMVVDLPPLLPLRSHEVDQGVQKNFDPRHYLKEGCGNIT